MRSVKLKKITSSLLLLFFGTMSLQPQWAYAAERSSRQDLPAPVFGLGMDAQGKISGATLVNPALKAPTAQAGKAPAGSATAGSAPYPASTAGSTAGAAGATAGAAGRAPASAAGSASAPTQHAAHLSELRALVRQARGRDSAAATDVRAVGPNVRISVESDPQARAAQANLLRSAAQHARQALALEAAVRQDLAAASEHIRRNNLPAEIAARQSEALAAYDARQSEFRAVAAGLEKAASGQGNAQSALAATAEFFDRISQSSGSAPLADANRLPVYTPPAAPRTPRINADQFKSAEFRAQPLRLAQAGSLSGVGLPSAVLPATPVAGDTAATEDAQITQAITDLANTLGNNPVKIHNWVRNNLRFVPGYGSMQGSAATLANLRGNAFDIASLEIALLRAANVPARYVYGTIEVPEERFNNWVGAGAGSLALLNQAGVPAQSALATDLTRVVQLEHVWAEAYVDFGPSRGAVNRSGSVWVPLDASFKQVQSAAGLSLADATLPSAAGTIDAGKQGAGCTADYASTCNIAALASEYASFKSALGAFITAQGKDISVAGVLGAQTITPENFAILAGTLPYKPLVEGAHFNVIPDNLRWKFSYRLYASSADRGTGTATVSLSQSLPALAGKRVTLSFAPATAADQATLQSYLPQTGVIAPGQFPASLPGYLIKVKAELRVDGAVLASGGSFTLGQTLIGVDAFAGAASSASADNPDHAVRAGDYQAVVIDAQGLPAGQINALKTRLAATKAKLDANNTGTLGRDDVTGDLLYQAGAAYFAYVDSTGDFVARAASATQIRLPSVVRAVAVAQPQVSLGVITQVRFPGVSLNIDRLAAATARQDGQSATALVRAAGERASAAAHLVLEKLYTDTSRPGEAASAVKAIRAGAASGKVFLITSDNVTTVLPQLTLDAATLATIQNAVAAGRRVLATQGTVTVGGAAQGGLVIEDPATGAGAYWLTGSPAENAAALIAAPQAGMFLGVGSPAQAAAGASPTFAAGLDLGTLLAALLGDASQSTSTRYAYFPGQNEVLASVFLARLAPLAVNGACDWTLNVAAAATAIGGIASGSGAANLPPVITSQPITAAQAGVPYSYAVLASDPNGDPITYSLSSAPSGMAIGASGLVNWARPVQGSVTVVVRADDGKAYTEQRYVLSTGTGPVPLDAALSVTPGVVNAGANVTVTLAVSGGSGNATQTLKLDGNPVTLSAGQASFAAGTSGAHRLTATITDGATTITRDAVYSVTDPTYAGAPTAQIITPAADAEVTAPVNVTGNANDAKLAFYQLLLRQADESGTKPWTEIARGYQPVVNGTLGKLDPTQLQNGIYELGLRVVNINGQEATQVVTVDVNRDLKIGQFSVSFLDLDVDAAGIPVRVTRTYDTKAKSQNLDFGYGWTVTYQDVVVRKNKITGLDWAVTTNQFQVCLKPVGTRKVNVTLPTGTVERFIAGNQQECAFGSVPDVAIQFNQLAGTTSQLEAINVPSLLVQGGQLLDPDGNPWNPTEFKLTTDDGFVYFLDQNFGIRSIKDPYGNTLTYSTSGIIHSAGLSVAFTRDATGRITQITDPKGQSIQYAYSGTGDLVSVTDRRGSVSHFSYNNTHGLVSYTDPLGTVSARYVYDDQGRLISAVDADGKSVDATHDTINSKETVKDRRGFATTYLYDSDGNLLETQDALGGRTRATFDGLGYQLSTTDATGRTTAFTVDGNGNTLTETDNLGKVTATSYGSTNNWTSETDPLGRVLTQDYDSSGSAIQFTDAMGNATQFGYDIKGNMTAMVDSTGKISRYEYDSQGRRTKETDPLGVVTTYVYDANGNQTTVSRTRTINGQQVTLTNAAEYDAEGNLVKVTDVFGRTSTSEYNAAGRQTATTDTMGRRTTYEYDSQARLVKTNYPDSTSSLIEYDPNGNKISETDRKGRVTRTDYDALNRPVKIIYPDGSSVASNYDAAGRLISSSDALGRTITSQFDPAGHLTQTTDVLGRSTAIQYDAVGNVTQETSTDGKTTRYEYDANNRVTKVTLPNGSQMQTTYDTLGRKTGQMDAQGNAVAFDYDANSRLTKVRQTIAGQTQDTSYTYDESNNKLTQTDARGRVTRWTYDEGDRVTSRTLPGGQVERFEYDAEGNRTSVTDFAGRITRYVYDQNDQLIQKRNPDGSSVNMTYTETGKVRTVQIVGAVPGSGMLNGMTSYNYDDNDRLIGLANPDGSGVAYGYDINGNRTTLTTLAPGGASVTTRYEYDLVNRLTKVTAPDGGGTSYTYDLANRKDTVTLPNGVRTKFGYDGNGRLNSIAHTRADGSLVAQFSYTLNAVGQKTSVNEVRQDSATATPGSRSVSYAYDVLNRLVSEQTTEPNPANNRTTTYAYDAVGNRQTKTVLTATGTATTSYTYDANDRLVQEDVSAGASTTSTISSYDAAGNLLSRQSGSGSTSTLSYAYDVDNRLIEVRQGSGPGQGSVIASYLYDSDGNKVAETIAGASGSTSTKFLVDTAQPYAQVVEERDGAGNVVRYTYGDERIARSQVDPSGQAMQNMYLQDGTGSVRALVDARGNVSDQYDFESFGTLSGSRGGTANRFLFTGEQFDPTARLYYLRARHMSPETGRFVSADPFEGSDYVPVSLNKYLYANADPVNKVDPSGMFSLAEIDMVQDIQAEMQKIRAEGLRQYIKKTISESIVDPRALAKFVKDCIKAPKKCPLTMSVLVTGFETPYTALHIHDAQVNGGSAPITGPWMFILNRQAGGGSRKWLSRTEECAASAKNSVRVRLGGIKVDCDEFPYNSTVQGGETRYRLGMVSLRPTPSVESPIQGGRLNGFYTKCRISKGKSMLNKKSRFFALGLWMMPGVPICAK